MRQQCMFIKAAVDMQPHCDIAKQMRAEGMAPMQSRCILAARLTA